VVDSQRCHLWECVVFVLLREQRIPGMESWELDSSSSRFPLSSLNLTDGVEVGVYVGLVERVVALVE
jgi:hypothetical protein